MAAVEARRQKGCLVGVGRLGPSVVLAALLALVGPLSGSGGGGPSEPRPCPEGLEKQVRRDASRGSATAQKRLGDLYAAGECVEKDYARAARWYRRSAKQGNADAQFELAMFLLEGKDVRRDPAEAAVWFRRAAEQGHSKAQYALGSLYVQGRGVPKDMVRGYAWIRISAPAEDVHTRDVLEMLTRSMTPAEVEKAESEARSWTAAHGASRDPGTAKH